MNKGKARQRAVFATDPVLVADVGGTYARLALASRDADDGLQAHSIAQFDVARFDSLEDVVREYLERVSPRPVHAVLAVAGPVTGDEVQITNSPWRISRCRFARELQFDSVRVVNDFAAMSAAIPGLSAGALDAIGPHAVPAIDRVQPRVMAVIGPGTGLGVSVMLMRDGRLLIIDTEGGHSAFA